VLQWLEHLALDQYMVVAWSRRLAVDMVELLARRWEHLSRWEQALLARGLLRSHK